MKISGVQVFSATMQQDRAELGNQVTRWIEENPSIEIVDKVVTQSSDDQFHCISIAIFYIGKATVAPRPFARREHAGPRVEARR